MTLEKYQEYCEDNCTDNTLKQHTGYAIVARIKIREIPKKKCL